MDSFITRFHFVISLHQVTEYCNARSSLSGVQVTESKQTIMKSPQRVNKRFNANEDLWNQYRSTLVTGSSYLGGAIILQH